MSEERRTTRAYCMVTVEVVCGHYGPDCSVQQTFDQAAREGVQALEILFQKEPHKFKVIGTPEVRTVIVKEKKL